MIVGNEPNLNRFWLPQFNEDGSGASAPAYLALLGESYDALKNAPETSRSTAARSRRAASTAPSPVRDTHLADAVHPRHGRGHRGGGRTADHGRPSPTPYQDNSSQSPTTRHPTSPTIGDRRLRQARRPARGGVRRDAQVGSGCRSSTTSTASSRSRRPEGGRYVGASRDHPAGRRAGRAPLPQALGNRLLPAERAWLPALPARRAGAAALAVGLLLPGRDGEVVAVIRAFRGTRGRSRQQQCAARSSESARACRPGMTSSCRDPGPRTPPVRPRLRLPRPLLRLRPGRGV